ncbi:MAG: 2-dehydro-3-deoxygalactonokinase [Bacteroidota bacterium]
MSGNPISSLFISCDWGSSQLRLALVDGLSRSVLANIHSPYGARSFFQDWSQSSLSRLQLGQARLSTELDRLSAISGQPLAGLPIIISGMASSSLGIQELPYAPVPFRLSGEDLIVESFPSNPDFPHPSLLVSGVQSGNEVMRGEEVQVIGLPSKLTQEACIWVLPGTHSKQMRISNGIIHSFNSILTGELFDLLSTYSTLSEGMMPVPAQLSPADFAAFDQGIDLGKDNQLLQNLFQVRSRRHEFEGSGRSLFLSGLLIGTEMQALRHQKIKIGLASSGGLGRLYARACEQLGMKDRLLVPDPKIISQLTILGQLNIWQNKLR